MSRLEWYRPTIKLDGVRADVHQVRPPVGGYPAVVDVCAGRWLAGSQPITPDAMCAT